MPQRPRSHVVGDIAANAVTRMCLGCGWACEVVHKDYGEDLFVQTTLDGQIDPFRFLMQVKGTENIERYHSKRFGYSIRFPSSLAREWFWSSHPVIVVLWDVLQQKGYWACPQTDWDLLEVAQEGVDKVRLAFPENQVVSVKALQQLGWQARLNHIYRLLAVSSAELSVEQVEGPGAGPPEYQNLESKAAAYDFLKRIGILIPFQGQDRVGIHRGFYDKALEALDRLRSDEEVIEDSGRELLLMAVLLSFLDRLRKLSGLPDCPDLVAMACSDVLMLLMEQLFRDSIPRLSEEEREAVAEAFVDYWPELVD